jgi:hypothetical protein
MAQKLDPKEIVSVEEAIIANAIEGEALVNLLEKKGIITRKELLEEVNELRKQFMK